MDEALDRRQKVLWSLALVHLSGHRFFYFKVTGLPHNRMNDENIATGFETLPRLVLTLRLLVWSCCL
jgi:hypothetical protein